MWYSSQNKAPDHFETHTNKFIYKPQLQSELSLFKNEIDYKCFR